MNCFHKGAQFLRVELKDRCIKKIPCVRSVSSGSSFATDQTLLARAILLEHFFSDFVSIGCCDL